MKRATIKTPRHLIILFYANLGILHSYDAYKICWLLHFFCQVPSRFIHIAYFDLKSNGFN